MEEITALAAYETINVLYNTEISLVCKIPYKFLEFLQAKAEEYEGEFELEQEKSLTDQNLSEETQAILAIIYKDYLCDEQEKEKINESIKKTNLDFEQEKNEKYSYENIFNSKTQESYEFQSSRFETKESKIENVKENSDVKNELIVQPKWYEKIILKIKSFFKIK